MLNIATLTMNPTIDVAYTVDTVRPTHKMRCTNEHFDPGGGGINVARVIVRLGGNAACYYLSGGSTAQALDDLLDLHQLVRRPIRIAGHTRMAFNAFEASTGKDYRFVPAGPTVSEAEWQNCLDLLSRAHCDYLIASGSLPPGVPDDFYARLARMARDRSCKLVLDTSGAALREGLAAGGVHLVKPSKGELSSLLGRDISDPESIKVAAQAIVAKGQAEMVAVTMGHEGAVFADRNGARYLPALPVEVKSAVGAGDSFTAAMVYRLASGWAPFDAFRYGIAAGSAAVMTEGTDLSRAEDIERLFTMVPES